MNYNLSRVTTQYIDNEDRLRILGESSEGKICEIWLSHRLLDRLVNNLLSNVQTDGPVDDVLQVFEQEAASFSLVEQPSVKKVKQPISWLATAIDIKRDNDITSLVFRDEIPMSAQISFQTIELRQWLSIIYNAYKLAEWSLEKWPGWFKESKEVNENSDTYSVH
jgi:hypothetical protein